MSKTAQETAIEALRTFDSPTIANAIEAFKVRKKTTGYASWALTCRFPELPPTVGYAVTCIADSTSETPTGPSRLYELFDAVAAAPKPVVVVIQQQGANRPHSLLAGDMLCTSFQKMGVAGLVTDGGIRDLSGIRKRAPGFQVFAGGVVVSHGMAVYLEVNVPVSICGLAIQPGDLLHGDESGLVSIPAEILESLPQQASTVQKKESEFIDFLNTEGWSLDDLKYKISH